MPSAHGRRAAQAERRQQSTRQSRRPQATAIAQVPDRLSAAAPPTASLLRLGAFALLLLSARVLNARDRDRRLPSERRPERSSTFFQSARRSPARLPQGPALLVAP